MLWEEITQAVNAVGTAKRTVTEAKDMWKNLHSIAKKEFAEFNRETKITGGGRPHHPQSVKRDIVKCLYERAKRLVTKPSVISEEKKHLSSVLVSNGYPSSFLQKLTKTGKPNNSAEPANEFKASFTLC